MNIMKILTLLQKAADLRARANEIEYKAIEQMGRIEAPVKNKAAERAVNDRRERATKQIKTA